MGHHKKENIVKIWFKKLSKVGSGEIQELVSKTGCPGMELPIWNNLDDAVIYTVIGQMLSGQAADAIVDKLYRNFKSSENLLRHFKVAEIYKPFLGLSRNKQKSLQVWANSSFRKEYKNADLNSQKDVRDIFNQVWGLGNWSADMLGIFYFCIPDVWPESDLKIKKYADKYFKGEKPLSISGLETITSLCIWQVVNNNLLELK